MAIKALEEAPGNIDGNFYGISPGQLATHFDGRFRKFFDERTDRHVNIFLGILVGIMMIPLAFLALANALMSFILIPLFAFSITRRIL